jgi:squalene cyclase
MGNSGTACRGRYAQRLGGSRNCLPVGTQKEDGSWDEEYFTGTGFPRVFYLKYHLYRQYFPLLALTTYAKVMEKNGN